MHLRLIRVAAVTLRATVPVTSWGWHLDDVFIQSYEHPKLTNDPGSLFLLSAHVDLASALPTEGTEIIVPDHLRRQLEEALESMANLLAITHQCGRSIDSPLPYIAVDPVDEEARQWISTASAIRTGEPGTPDRMKHGLDLDAVAPLLCDRLDGAALLAEALCQDHPTGKLHEFMRLFERAFARSARTVCGKLLADYLRPLNWGYDEAEVHHWLHLRDTATHADRRDEYADEADTRAVINRVEQAGFDVLFNKDVWREASVCRRSALNPIYGSLAATGWKMFKTPEATVDVLFAFFDGFGSYPLDMRLDMYRCVPKTWFTRTTDVKPPPPDWQPSQQGPRAEVRITQVEPTSNATRS